MVMLRDLRPASFRGARFLCPHDQGSEGRNTIDHRYPDSSRRYAEDNGYIPPEFEMTAVLHGPNLLSDFNALRSALNRPGPGTLHHPWYGAQFCAVKGPWKVDRKDEDSGVLTLTITFLVTGPSIFPGIFGAIAAVVTGLSGSLVQSLFDEFVSAFGAPRLADVSLAAVASASRSVASEINSGLGQVASVRIATSHIIDYAERYVQDGAMLGPELANMFRGAFEDVADTYPGSAIAKTMSTVIDVLDGIDAETALIPSTTVDYLSRAAALTNLSVYIRVAAVSSLAEALVGADYVTADSVHLAQDELVTRYTSIPVESLSASIAKQIEDVVSSALDVLRRDELQLPKIETMKVTEFPSSVLAYMLYDTDSRVDTLIDLNLDQNPLLFDGSVNVLAEAG